MPTLTIGDQKIDVDDGFLSLSADQQNAAVDEIAKGLGSPGFVLDPPKKLGSGVTANFAAGANEFIAGAAGAPVDLLTGALNLVPRGINAAAGTSIPTIQNPFGGAESIKNALGTIGIDPREVVAGTTAERASRGVGGAVPAMVAPYLGARAAIESGATGILPRLFGGPAGPGQSGFQTAAGAVGNAAVGAGGALGGQAAEALVPEGSAWAAPANLGGQLVGGGLVAGALPVALGAAARVVQPNSSPDIRLLMEAGVRPTPGQILGGRANRLEEAFTSIPLVGDAVKGARTRANEQFNRGAINRALAPIGQKLDDATPLGREAIDDMQGKISAAYQEVVPKLSATVDRELADDVVKLRDMSKLMPAGNREQFEQVIQQEVASRLSPSGKMTGESFQSLDELLGKTARDYRYSSNGGERQYGNAIHELQESMRDWLQRGNPASTEYANARRAYALGERVNVAAAKPGADPGVFSPAQLQASVRQLDPTLLKHAFSRGGALMQDYADAGRSVLGSRLPDSGTAYRGMFGLSAGLLAGTNPGTLATAIPAGLGALASYSPRGQAAIAHLLTTRPGWAPDVADALRQFSPPARSAASYPLWGSFAP